ncbi:NAD(P)-binding protein [Paeniglutamicibacter sp.]
MRALVVGAGIGGLAAGGALARNGWQTTVLEQAPGPAPPAT